MKTKALGFWGYLWSGFQGETLLATLFSYLFSLIWLVPLSLLIYFIFGEAVTLKLVLPLAIVGIVGEVALCKHLVTQQGIEAATAELYSAQQTYASHLKTLASMYKEDGRMEEAQEVLKRAEEVLKEAEKQERTVAEPQVHVSPRIFSIPALYVISVLGSLLFAYWMMGTPRVLGKQTSANFSVVLIPNVSDISIVFSIVFSLVLVYIFCGSFYKHKK